MNINITAQGATQNRSVRTQTNYKVERPNKLYVDTKNRFLHLIMVTDGHSKWTYSSKSNSYTEEILDSTQTDTANVNSLLQNLKGKFSKQVSRAMNPLENAVKHTTMLGRETLMMPDSTKRQTYKLRVKYDYDSLPMMKKIKKNPYVKDIKMSPTTFWLDNNRHVILKTKVNGKPIYKKGMPVPIDMTMNIEMYYTSYDLNPVFSDSTFSFRPPKGAKKVKNLKVLNKQAIKSAKQ